MVLQYAFISILLQLIVFGETATHEDCSFARIQRIVELLAGATGQPNAEALDLTKQDSACIHEQDILVPSPAAAPYACPCLTDDLYCESVGRTAQGPGCVHSRL